MKKKYSLYVALASVMLATSCSTEQDTMGGRISNRSILLNPTVPHAATSRAVETTIDNLDAFKVTAFLPGADNYMENVAYTKADGAWSTNEGNFFWPTSSEYLNFYAYAPAEPCKMSTNEDADGASFNINHQFQKLENFSPNAAAAEQKDFIYAYAKGNLEENGTDGVDIKFKHALSQITIAAKNDNKAYTVKVSGVKIGNVMSKSTFSFPSSGGDGNDASWSQDSQTGSYTTEWENGAVELSSDVKDFKDQGNVPFMLIPQSLTSANKAADGAYIALKVSIAMQGGKVLCSDKWAYVGIGDSWQMGKRYNYTLDFSNGAGQDADGNLIISGKGIKLSVNMGDWTAEDVDIPENNTLPELPATANCLILDPTGSNVGKIDVVNNINIFWSNPDVGDAANVLDKKSEWVAEVIWQDINSRAINFCNAAGDVAPGDTYEGKGNQPLYIKAVGGKKGNVVVGVKKKGAGNDAYLWSWHLWITEEPQLVSGFMDRNLGAMSANPSDGDKTYGLYYQFGRKDPFTGDIDRYDINGTSIGKTTLTSGKVTFAKAMQTPGVFYTFGNSLLAYDWASPNNYNTKKWNDITDAAGKSLFDPSPEGWRLPSKEEYSDFDTKTFIWDSSNKGSTYNANWFPAAGERNINYGKMEYVGRKGNCWNSSPKNHQDGCRLVFCNDFLYTDLSNPRANGYSVRCVQE